jgi:hypothetical protein
MTLALPMKVRLAAAADAIYFPDDAAARRFGIVLGARSARAAS